MPGFAGDASLYIHTQHYMLAHQSANLHYVHLELASEIKPMAITQKDCDSQCRARYEWIRHAMCIVPLVMSKR